MIIIKRNCSSSVRLHEDDKITFGDFTITLDGADYLLYEKIRALELEACSHTVTLQKIILAGLRERVIELQGVDE